MKVDDLQSIVEFIFKYIPNRNISEDRIAKAKLIAHRGWHENEVIENTHASFDLARKFGLYGIEFDIRWTKDYVPVVHHDANTRRVFDKKCDIFEVEYEELKHDFPQIPTLADVIDDYSNYLVLFIELKYDRRYDMNICSQKLNDLLKNKQAIKHFNFITLNEKCLQMVDQFTNGCKYLIAKTNVKKISEICLDRDLAGFLGHFLLTYNEIIQKHHSSGQLIGTGQVNNINTLKRELSRNVDFIFTNKPWNLITN